MAIGLLMVGIGLAAVIMAITGTQGDVFRAITGRTAPQPHDPTQPFNPIPQQALPPQYGWGQPGTVPSPSSPQTPFGPAIIA